MGWSCAKCERDPDECAACFRGKNMNRVMDHMNERIDVLAVMGKAAALLHDLHPRHESPTGRELMEASAAVAELIEADKEYDDAHAEFYAVAMDRETANERYMRQGRYITARKRRAAALARVGGAS